MSEAITKPPLRERIGFQGFLLGGFSLIATLMLVLGNLSTFKSIGERTREDLRASLAQVVPPSIHDNDLLTSPLHIKGPNGKPLTVYRATEHGKLSALAWQVVAKGYAGPIRLIMAVNAKGEILGIRVLSNHDTPGLGDKIELSKTKWILAFDGLSLANTPLKQWYVKKDGGRFDQFSGATITPRGVVAGIRHSLQFFQAHQKTMLAAPQFNPLD